MKMITIAPIANQSFSINLEEERYDFTIKETRGVMSVTIVRDNVTLVQNVRMVAGTPLIPYRYLMLGNFFLLTTNEEYPDYTLFGVTQQLVYLTDAEITALQSEGVIEPRGFVPSLSFNFAGIMSLTSAEGFEITFARATEASYYDAEGLLTFAAIDEPRFDHNPDTLDSLGLLLESPGTNLCAYSQQFDDASWTKTNATIAANSATAPDGTSTADELLDNITNGVHTAGRSISFSNATVYTYSVFLKAGDRTVAKISLPTAAFSGAPYCFVNLLTGALGTPSGCTATIQELPNDWFRFSITATSTSASSGSITVGTALDLTTDSYVGDGSGIYTWGGQVEARAYASSYVRTTTTSLTRAGELATMLTDGGWMAEQLGTIYSEMLLVSTGIATGRTAVELSDGTANNLLKHYVDGSDSNKRKILLKDSSVDQFAYVGTAYGFTVPSRVATAYKENAVIAATDGILSTFDDDADIPDFTEIAFGSIYNGTAALDGWLQQVQYYPEYLSNPVLKGMTE